MQIINGNKEKERKPSKIDIPFVVSIGDYQNCFDEGDDDDVNNNIGDKFIHVNQLVAKFDFTNMFPCSQLPSISLIIELP